MPTDCDYELWYPLPGGPGGADKFFFRGDWCGIDLPGAPFVPGGPSPNTQVMMSALLDRYPADVRAEYLALYAGWYTHLQRSVGHALAGGASIQQYVDLSLQAKRLSLHADHWFLAGQDCWGDDCRDRDYKYWAAKLDPWIDALLDAEAIDTACVGWQLDGYNIPGEPIKGIIYYIADRLTPYGIPVYTHWINDAGGWWAAGSNRFEWWQQMRGRLSGMHLQVDTRAPMKPIQEAIRALAIPFNNGQTGTSGLFGDKPYTCVFTEYAAQDRFDQKPGDPTHSIMSVDQADERGFLGLCTKGFPVGGFYGGGRGPDGSVL